MKEFNLEFKIARDNGGCPHGLHSNKPCVTCRAVESQTRDVVQSDFASEVKSGNRFGRFPRPERSGPGEDRGLLDSR